MESTRGNRAPALIEAAQELFFEKGYTGTTMEQVSRSASFSKRTVYLYFKNKDELFLAVVSRGLGILQQELEEIDIHALDYEQAIESIMEAYIRFATQNPRYFQFAFHDATAEMMANVSPTLREQITSQERACLAVPARVVEKGVAEGVVPPVEPEEAAIVFWGTVTGIILLSLGGSQTVLPDNRIDIIRQAVWVLYNGFRNLPGAPWPGRATGGDNESVEGT